MENSFSSLHLSSKILKKIEEKGYREPTEIQKLCIPLLLEDNSEIIAQAETGSGKTAAFSLPILDRIEGNNKEVEALILTPTRELCLQICEEMRSLKYNEKTEVLPIYGGEGIEKQLRSLKKGASIVVGTPGRILDHIKRKTLSLSNLKFFVLDEADEMLDMGFIDDTKEILSVTNSDKRTLFFSATMPKEVLSLALSFTKESKIIRTQKKEMPVEGVEQIYYEVKEKDKIELLTRIINEDDDFYGVIFCRTKVQCDEIGKTLSSLSYNASSLHGDLTQRERENVIKRMRDKTLKILVATDVASRGLDISSLNYVINYSLPEDEDVYIHRVGRTARAGKKGKAITFVSPKEKKRFSFIQKRLNGEIKKEEIPTKEEIIKKKKEKIEKTLRERFSSSGKPFYKSMAENILSGLDSINALSLLLEDMYDDKLNINNYKEISNEKSKEDVSFTRMKIDRGRKDGMNKTLLLSYLNEKAKIKSEDIKDISIEEGTTFFSIPRNKKESVNKLFSYKSDKKSEKSKRDKNNRQKRVGGKRDFNRGKRR